MCTPLAAIGAGLSIAGQAANFSAQSAATQAYNSSVLQNAQSAGLAETHKVEDYGRKMIYDARQTQQEGYNAVMKGRAAHGTALASSGSSGFDGSSYSINDILAGIDQQTAQSVDNVQTKMDDLKNTYLSSAKTAEAEAQGRINSMPMKAGPNPLSLVIGAGGAGVDGMKAAGVNFGTLFAG